MAELKLLWKAEISKPKARMIYVTLIVYFKKELNILRVAIDVLDIFQLFVGCLQNEDICRRAGGAGPTTSTLVGPKNLLFMVKAL